MSAPTLAPPPDPLDAWSPEELDALRGSTLPRIYTPPLVTGPPGPCGCGCALTPETSEGFDVVDFAVAIRRPLDPWQRWLAIHAMELLPDGFPRFRQVLVLVARQNGKALDCATPILTTNGWSTMGDLRAGDEVFHPGGNPVRVIGAFETMHGHDCYRVTTSDGRSVVADADHLWTVRDRRRSRAKGPRGASVRSYPSVTMTTAQMLAAGLSASATGARSNGRNEYRFALPTQEPIKSADVDLPVDPYLLGMWLGDGTSAAAAVTVGALDLPAVLAEIVRAGAQVVSQVQDRRTGAWRVGFRIDAAMRDGFQSRMMRLGVWRNKHVPDLYLTAGTGQREALLQGLMDADGSISANGQAEFCSVSPQLAEAVLYLARSLGWRATRAEGRATIRGRDCGPKYRVCFTPVRTDPFCPFRLPRKVARIKAIDGGAGRSTVSIASITPVESRPVRCIKVDSPDGLFLAGRDLVATHNTELLVVLTLYWLYIVRVEMVVSTSSKLDYAKESWTKACKLARRVDFLDAQIPKNGIRKANGEQELIIRDPDDPDDEDHRYKIGAANEEGGRSLTIDRLIEDELRQHHDWSAHEAAENAMNAVEDGQAWAISNQGDDRAVVLHSLHSSAVDDIKGGVTDSDLGLFEWSAPAGCEVTDPAAIAQANPNLNRRLRLRGILQKAKRAKAKGGEQLARFRIEVLCQRVKLLDPAIDPAAWTACLNAGTLDGFRSRLAVVVDVAPDSGHVTLAAAAVMPDGRVRVEAIKSWEGAGCTQRAAREIPRLVGKIRPKAFGWLPGGPGATLAADLKERKVRTAVWPPFGVTVTEIRSEVSAVCMGFAALVDDHGVVHSGQEGLDAQIEHAERLKTGDTWRFSRKGEGHVDAVYAVAGAAHLARTLPEANGLTEIITAGSKKAE